MVPRCLLANTIGWYCDVPSTACDTLQPCQNQGNCTNSNTTSSGYVCSCPIGLGGALCQFDHRPCRADTCWNNGTCTQTSQSTARLLMCDLGWRGQSMRDTGELLWQCHMSENNGVCRGSLLNYTCQCLGDSFSGRHCEIKATGTVVHQIVARSFAYVAIIALGTLLSFVMFLDVLKYYFGIDSVREDRKHKSTPRRYRGPSVAIRFLYVNR